MGRKKNQCAEKGFVQAAALILHESKLVISPEETTAAGRFFTDNLTPKGASVVTAFEGETTGIRAIFIKPERGRLDMLFELQNGQRFTAITTENFMACLREGRVEEEEHAE